MTFILGGAGTLIELPIRRGATGSRRRRFEFESGEEAGDES